MSKNILSSVVVFVPRFHPEKAYGAVVYIENTLNALHQILDKNRVIVLCDSAAEHWFSTRYPNFVVWAIYSPRSQILSLLNEYLLLARARLKLGPVTFFFPLNIKPAVRLKSSVLMLHDLAAEFYRKSFPSHQKIFYFVQCWLVRLSLFTSQKVVVPSAAIQAEVVDRYPSLEHKITVLPEGVKLIEASATDRAETDYVELLQTGAKMPHKMQHLTLEALGNLKRSHPESYSRLKLTILGGASDEVESLRSLAKELDVLEKVQLLGKVDEATLDAQMQAADAMIFPSIYEGFGLGVLECRALRKPFIASDIPVLREVGQADGLFFEPGSARALTETLNRFVCNNGIAQARHQPASGKVKLPSWTEHGAGLAYLLDN